MEFLLAREVPVADVDGLLASANGRQFHHPRHPRGSCGSEHCPVVLRDPGSWGVEQKQSLDSGRRLSQALRIVEVATHHVDASG